jgi:hypothetical protein
MSEGKGAQNAPAEAPARLHFFSTKKRLASGDVEPRITVREYAPAEIGELLFLAETDRERTRKPRRSGRAAGAGRCTAGCQSACGTSAGSATRNLDRLQRRFPTKRLDTLNPCQRKGR